MSSFRFAVAIHTLVLTRGLPGGGVATIRFELTDTADLPLLRMQIASYHLAQVFLIEFVARKEIRALHEKHVRLRVLGRMEELPRSLQAELRRDMLATIMVVRSNTQTAAVGDAV